MNSVCKLENFEVDLFWDFWLFVMYYMFGSVRDIPTYRVDQLYDTISCKQQSNVKVAMATV